MLKVLNLPNTLTILRILLIPVFVTAIIYGRYDYALYIFVIAALTDSLDGLIARLKNQKTTLGTFLDPLADKFLLVTSFILFATYGLIPKWLTITIISRDIIILMGWLILYIVFHTTKVEPTILGKSAIASQLILISYVLFNINFPVWPSVHDYLIWITAAFTITSCLGYIYRGFKHTNAQR